MAATAGGVEDPMVVGANAAEGVLPSRTTGSDIAGSAAVEASARTSAVNPAKRASAISVNGDVAGPEALRPRPSHRFSAASGDSNSFSASESDARACPRRTVRGQACYPRAIRLKPEASYKDLMISSRERGECA